MNTLQIVYKILHALDHAEERSLMGQLISSEKLDITPDEWLGVMSLLIDEGCVSGVSFSCDVYGCRTANVETAHITLKGAEYLHTSDVMRKYHAAASGYTFDDEYYAYGGE